MITGALQLRLGRERGARRIRETGPAVRPPCEALLDWYAANGRALPWRETSDPYAILVSEVMLQQTQVERVVPRWRRWLERWPTVEALAAATPAEVIVEWQGLGYNRRAVNLHRAARVVAASGLAGRPDRAARRRAVHGRRGRQLRVRPRRAAGRHERPPRAGAHRRGVRRLLRAGALRSRRDDLPRARPALRGLPARRGVPVAREPVRAAPKAVAVRGLVPAAPRGRAQRRSPPAPAPPTARRSSRSSATGS